MGFETLIVFAKDVGGVGAGVHHTFPVCLSRASVPESAWEPLFASAQIQKHLPPLLPWSGAVSSGSSADNVFCIVLLPEAFPPLPCMCLTNTVI